MELAAVIPVIHPSGFLHPFCSLLAGLGTWASPWACDPEAGMAGVEQALKLDSQLPQHRAEPIPAGKMRFLRLVIKVFCCFSC